ncbi:MAG TPA: GNAT family protein [Micropepsaceae bacterium]|nr:GNAT family protein [Micropepsaceae bacterium]
MVEEKPATRNRFGQPIGFAVPDWNARAAPSGAPIAGRYCSLEGLDAERHANDLHAAYGEAQDARDWTYLAAGPFASLEEHRDYLRAESAKRDPLHYAIRDSLTGKAVGTAALLRIDSANGVIEVGHIHYSPRLQRSRAGTEAMFLLMRYAFDALGYRRYEWKCDSLNAPSRRAAERYGFVFEGIFRQAMVRNGHNRDTAWYSIIDQEWPLIRSAFEHWLAPENFDSDGSQRQSLRTMRESLAGAPKP